MPKANDPRITSTHGHDPDADGAAPGPIDPKTGMHTSYWVLTPEERAKGFVRPVRKSYIHSGIRPKYKLRDLTDDEKIRYEKFGYTMYEPYPKGKDCITGRYWTDAQLNSGCGEITTMSTAIAETYARDPKFYGSTFCSRCRQHFSVEEFVWVDEQMRPTRDVLGS